MTLSAREREQRMIADVRAALGRPTLLHVALSVLVHEHAPPGSPPCPCCGVEFARIAETIPDGEVLIDRESGKRYAPGDLTVDTWRRATAIAERHEIRLRVSRDQMPLVMDDSDRHLLVAGSNRAGKTVAGLNWLVRQWVRRGGFLRRFWLVGKSQERAYHLLRKLVDGDGRTPGILPAALVARRPSSHRAADLTTTLADGSLLQLRFYGGETTAENLKSDPVIAAVVDEAAEMKHEAALTALKGRCVDERGRLWLATTPTPGSFLKVAIVDQVAEWGRLPDDHPARATGAHPGAGWISASLSMGSNPWIDPEHVRQIIAAANPEDPSTRRDFFGEWNSGAGRLWRFEPDRHVFVHEARRVADMWPTVHERAGCRQVRVTDKIVDRLFRARENPLYRGLKAANGTYILGGDVNLFPQSTVVLEVTADAANPTDRDRWHVWVHDVIVTSKGGSLGHVERLASTSWARALNPVAVESPYRGCGIIIDPQAIHHDPTAVRFGLDPRGFVQLFGDHGFDARSPQYKVTEGGRRVPVSIGRRDSHLLLHRLIDTGRLHVSQRALPLITSLCEQEAGPDGIQPLTKSHSKSDRLASSVDALRYPLWSIFHGHDAAA